MSKKQTYDWVTDEMFDGKLEELVDDMDPGQFMAIPGIYEILKEHFNNEVLEALEDEHDEEDVDDED